MKTYYFLSLILLGTISFVAKGQICDDKNLAHDLQREMISNDDARLTAEEFVQGFAEPYEPVGWAPYQSKGKVYAGPERGVTILQEIPADKHYRMKGSNDTLECTYFVDEGAFETGFFEFMTTFKPQKEPVIKKGSVYYLESSLVSYIYNSFRGGDNLISFYLNFKNPNEVPKAFRISCTLRDPKKYPPKMREEILNLPMQTLEQGFEFNGEKNFKFIE